MEKQTIKGVGDIPAENIGLTDGVGEVITEKDNGFIGGTEEGISGDAIGITGGLQEI